jgi:uncharacterized protein YaeQ
MTITGPQARAARALIQWPRDHVARLAGLTVEALADFERNGVDPGPDERLRLQVALEQGGAVFLGEDNEGVGVRLKFTRKEVRSIRRMENEGGPVGDDDV